MARWIVMLLLTFGCAVSSGADSERLPPEAGQSDAKTVVPDAAFPVADTDGGEPVDVDAPVADAGKTYNQCPADPLGPQKDDDSGLAPGPIVRITVHVLAIYAKEGGFRPIEQDAFDRYLVKVGDSFVLDATQKNAPAPSGPESICQWQSLPVWYLDDPTCSFRRTAEENPWLLDAKVLDVGEISAFIVGDGVTSNTIVLVSSP